MKITIELSEKDGRRLVFVAENMAKKSVSAVAANLVTSGVNRILGNYTIRGDAQYDTTM